MDACQRQTVPHAGSEMKKKKEPGLAFAPPVNGSEKLLASGERQRRDRASGKRQYHTIAAEGEGDFWGVG